VTGLTTVLTARRAAMNRTDGKLMLGW